LFTHSIDFPEVPEIFLHNFIFHPVYGLQWCAVAIAIFTMVCPWAQCYSVAISHFACCVSAACYYGLNVFLAVLCPYTQCCEVAIANFLMMCLCLQCYSVAI
jgi:hypothetical protein